MLSITQQREPFREIRKILLRIYWAFLNKTDNSLMVIELGAFFVFVK